MEPKQDRKIYTFSPGPCILPVEILETAQKEFLDYQGCGISVFEMSHRSKDYTKIIKKAEQDLRDLLKIPSNYKVLFMQGGASLQFACAPLNLLSEKKKVNYLVTGHWGEKAFAEAKKYTTELNEVVPIKTTKGSKYSMVPAQSEWKVDEDAAYFHYTENETIAGVEFQYVPELKDQLLVCDMSSNFCSRPIDISKFGLIYAGAQKNVGPAGCTIVIVREDLLGKSLPICPTMCDYKTQADAGSLYNTGPTYNIYMCGLFFQWLKDMGGLEAVEKIAKQKADIIYNAIDNSNGFYSSPVQKEFRSRVNIPFLVKGGEAAEKKFVAEANAAGLIQLEGHRSVGGCRASIYNGMPMAGVVKLKEFMEKFAKENQ